MENRTLPQNLEAERYVISCMATYPGCIADVLDEIQVDDFYAWPEGRIIFDAITKLYSEGVLVDAVSIRDELKQAGSLERIGGISELAYLLDFAPSTAMLNYHLEVLRGNTQLRAAIQLCHERAAAAYDTAARDAGAFTDDFADAAVRLADGVRRGGADSAGAIAEGVVADLIEPNRPHREVLTGFDSLDYITGGLHPGEYIILGARPSMGKTALGLDIAYHTARRGEGVLFVSLEMPKEKIIERLLIKESGIESDRIRRRDLNTLHYVQLKSAQKQIQDLPLYLVGEKGYDTPAAIRGLARKYQREKDIRLVVVDYLNRLRGPGKSFYEKTTEISSDLKSMAMELNIPLLVLCQLNRQNEQREGHRPKMSDLRDSGGIEQDADIIALLHNEDYFHRGESGYDKQNIADVIVGKHRNGKTGVARLTWDGETMTFKNLGGTGGTD